jgi:hypothetical protein
VIFDELQHDGLATHHQLAASSAVALPVPAQQIAVTLVVARKAVLAGLCQVRGRRAKSGQFFGGQVGTLHRIAKELLDLFASC